MNKLGQLAYLGQWYVRALLGRRAPLQSVIFILDRCNLRCKHCSVYELEHPRCKSFDTIREELEDCYRAGSRFVDFEGGELYLWKDLQAPGDNQPAAEYDINVLQRILLCLYLRNRTHRIRNRRIRRQHANCNSHTYRCPYNLLISHKHYLQTKGLALHLVQILIISQHYDTVYPPRFQ